MKEIIKYINPNVEKDWLILMLRKGLLTLMLRKVLLTLNVEKGFINPIVETQPPCVQQRAGSGERGDQCDAGL